ncbi:MAG TPA: hypothetical protein VF974_03095 [Patescibacteria group bacterium]
MTASAKPATLYEFLLLQFPSKLEGGDSEPSNWLTSPRLYMEGQESFDLQMRNPRTDPVTEEDLKARLAAFYAPEYTVRRQGPACWLEKEGQSFLIVISCNPSSGHIIVTVGI